jgi:hypothetical protein
MISFEWTRRSYPALSFDTFGMSVEAVKRASVAEKDAKAAPIQANGLKGKGWMPRAIWRSSVIFGGALQGKIKAEHD